jgi:hypothetical protein
MRLRQQLARDRLTRKAGPDWCSIYSNVIRGRRKILVVGDETERGRCGGVGVTCQPARAGEQNLKPKGWVGVGTTEYGGVRGCPRPLTLAQAATSDRHLRSLPRIFPTPHPSFWRSPLLDTSPSPTIAIVTSHCPPSMRHVFPSLFTPPFYNLPHPNKNPQKTQNYMAAKWFLSISRFLFLRAIHNH